MSRASRSGNPAIRAQSTGLKVEARHRHHAELPTPRPGVHMWVVMGMWTIARPGDPSMQLDIENLATLEGPGCFWCEQTYDAATAGRPCPGEPALEGS